MSSTAIARENNIFDMMEDVEYNIDYPSLIETIIDTHSTDKSAARWVLNKVRKHFNLRFSGVSYITTMYKHLRLEDDKFAKANIRQLLGNIIFNKFREIFPDVPPETVNNFLQETLPWADELVNGVDETPYHQDPEPVDILPTDSTISEPIIDISNMVDVVPMISPNIDSDIVNNNIDINLQAIAHIVSDVKTFTNHLEVLVDKMFIPFKQANASMVDINGKAIINTLNSVDEFDIQYQHKGIDRIDIFRYSYGNLTHYVLGDSIV